MNNKRNYIYIVRGAMREVFRSTWYVALALMTSAIIFAVAVLLPNLGLIARIIGDANIPLASKLQIPINFLGSILTNFSVLSASYTVAIAALFGVNIAMISYYLKRKRTNLRRQEMMAGMGGVTSGVFGVGCAACGSFLLSSFLSFVGASGALALLPLRGGEFGILSVILLGFSVTLISRKIAEPLVCNSQKS